ncbi:hypothetical protein PLESTB_000392100 [Pleodorina starrii]|uniref:C2HC zinc finger plants domain-containing protein n=1 Tax=Pleodorina starrii TaxID=330485 RepID=A0A9W6EZF5_9CHLO|nr:hypothetical protein PLESTB_000392100 [Pleodorina starrii]GLC73214.1 hypothetical protein PLESTF_001347800 [Pleodorina starrii]
MNVPSGTNDAGIQGLIRDAYSAIAGGDPTQALRFVLAALHATGGQAAAAPALNRVLTQLTANDQVNALQELTELFARAASVRSEEPAPPPPPRPQPPAQAPPAWRDATATATATAAATITAATPGAGAGGWLPGPSCSGGSDSMSCNDDDAPSAAWPSQSPSAAHSMDAEGAGGGGRLGGAAPAGWWAGGERRGGGGGMAGGGGGGMAGGAGGGEGWGQEATSAWVGPGSLGPQPQTPILSETGREGFMECALQDGSSYVCGRCRGVVLIHRRQQHEAFWCQGAAGAGRGGGGGGGAEE